MPQYTIMSYNIEYMKRLFRKNKIEESEKPRVKKISRVIRRIDPHLLGIVEASSKSRHHELFIKAPEGLSGSFQYVMGKENRGSQDLVIYYRDPFEVVAVDEESGFYDPWLEDIDDDGIQELCVFERKPLEVLFRIKGTEIRFYVILISGKSKGVFTVNDLLAYQKRALSNRKKLLAQAKKIRSRLDQLMEREETMPVILMGDMNDEPGLDEYQKQVGASSIETLMGSVFEPEKILHNTLWYKTRTDQRKALWTTEFPDQIVANLANHKVWIDHILVSPDMLQKESRLRYVSESAEVGKKDEISKAASDHYPVFCRLEVDDDLLPA